MISSHDCGVCKSEGGCERKKVFKSEAHDGLKVVRPAEENMQLPSFALYLSRIGSFLANQLPILVSGQPSVSAHSRTQTKSSDFFTLILRK